MLIMQTSTMIPTLGLFTREVLLECFMDLFLATGLASMIFMAWAFYVETTGRGALFIEPNRVLAAGELATVATGMIALLVLFFRGLSQKEQSLTESLQE